jgi:hypothetical protein
MSETHKVEVTWREPEGGVVGLADLCHMLLTKVPCVYELHLNAMIRDQCMIGAVANPARVDANELADGIVCILERFGVKRRHITIWQIRGIPKGAVVHRDDGSEVETTAPAEYVAIDLGAVSASEGSDGEEA